VDEDRGRSKPGRTEKPSENDSNDPKAKDSPKVFEELKVEDQDLRQFISD